MIKKCSGMTSIWISASRVYRNILQGKSKKRPIFPPTSLCYDTGSNVCLSPATSSAHFGQSLWNLCTWVHRYLQLSRFSNRILYGFLSRLLI